MIALLLACADPVPPRGDTPEDLVALAGEPGPYSVGYTVDAVSYTVNDGSETVRTLRLALWYPTRDTEGPSPLYAGFFPTDSALTDAKPEGEDLPVLLFSHGHRGYAEASSFLMEHFASHGFLVAAPDHTRDTTFDPPDRDTEIYYQRPMDLTAVLDHLDTLPTDHLLAGRGGQRTLAIGHSFGGYTLFAASGAPFDTTVLDACDDGSGPLPFCSTWTPAHRERFAPDALTDSRIEAILPMAPGDYRLFGTGLTELNAPAFLFTGGLDDQTGTDSAPIWQALSEAPAHRRLHLPAGGHNTFTDFSGTIDSAEGLVDPQTGFQVIRTYAMAWAYDALGDGRFKGVLDGTSTVSDAVVLSRSP